MNEQILSDISEESKICEILKSKYNCRIIYNETYPYYLYCAMDISKILNLKTINTSLIKINSDDKKQISTKTNGGIQKITFLTYNGLVRIITKSRKKEAVALAKDLNINITCNMYINIECETISMIIKAFNGENMREQYKIDNYIIDLYFIDYKLAVECDENHHNYFIEKDSLRENEIKEKLNCKFIRYKPFDKNFDIFIIINKIYNSIKVSQD